MDFKDWSRSKNMYSPRCFRLSRTKWNRWVLYEHNDMSAKGGHRMTLQEEREALQKRMDEIDKEIAGFVPGWYVKWDNDSAYVHTENIKTYDRLQSIQNLWQHVEPFHLVVHKFLPEGWKVVPPEAGTLYDWSKAPEWANWAATDENGAAYWFEEKPVISEEGDDLWCSDKWYEEADETTTIYRIVPWDQSLEQRPGITQ